MARLPCVNGPRHSDRSCLASLPALQHVLHSYHYDCRLPIPWNLILKVSSSTSHRRHGLVCNRAKSILTAVAHSENVSRALDLLDLCSDFRSIDANHLHTRILGRDGLLRELRCGSRDPHSFHQNSTADLPIPWTPHLALFYIDINMSECYTPSDPCLECCCVRSF